MKRKSNPIGKQTINRYIYCCQLSYKSHNPETRRIRGDLIKVHRIINGIEGIDGKLLFFKAPYDGTIGHTIKLEKKVKSLDVHKYFVHKE